MNRFILLLFSFILLQSCCKDEKDCSQKTTLVNHTIDQEPFSTLSEYNLFQGELKNLEPVEGVLPYALINKLFTDYSLKKRFVWMPACSEARYVSDYESLDFPTGTILVKNFYYENVLPNMDTKIVETRLMLRDTDRWTFATYKWNDAQTEADLDMSGVDVPVAWMQDGIQKNVDFRIPSGAECHTCHKANSVDVPLGPKPQNINVDYAYADGTKNQLQKMVDMGYLDANYPSDIVTVANWKDTSLSLETRVRSYVDINCSHCHIDEGHCNYRVMRFAFKENDTDESLGICIEQDEDIPGEGLSHIVSPARPDRSVLYYRFNTTDETVRMPLLGRSLIHTEATQLIEDWISSLDQECE